VALLWTSIAVFWTRPLNIMRKGSRERAKRLAVEIAVTAGRYRLVERRGMNGSATNARAKKRCNAIPGRVKGSRVYQG